MSAPEIFGFRLKRSAAVFPTERDLVVAVKMNENKKAPAWAIATSIPVCLVGGCVLFVLCQSFYLAFIVGMRVFFPFILSPIIFIVGLWWFLCPWLTASYHGRAGYINLILATVSAGVFFAAFLLPLIGIYFET